MSLRRLRRCAPRLIVQGLDSGHSATMPYDRVNRSYQRWLMTSSFAN